MQYNKGNYQLEAFDFMPETVKKGAKLTFNEIALSVTVEPNASFEEIKKAALEELMDNLYDYIPLHTHIEELPEEVLFAEDVFLGQIVKVNNVNKSIGVITRICRHVNKAVTVQFSDGTSEIFEYQQLSRVEHWDTSITFQSLNPTYDGTIVNNAIYYVKTANNEGLAVTNINHSDTSRLGVNFLNASKKNAEYMPIDEFRQLII